MNAILCILYVFYSYTVIIIFVVLYVYMHKIKRGFFWFFVFSVKIIRAHFSSLNGNYSIPLKQVDSYIILYSNFFFVYLFLSLDI